MENMALFKEDDNLAKQKIIASEME